MAKHTGPQWWKKIKRNKRLSSALIVSVGVVACLIATVSFIRAPQTAKAGPASGVTYVGTHSPKPAPCDAPGFPACPAIDPGWTPLNAGTASAVATAITGSGMFATMSAHHGGKTLDLPVLVRTLTSGTGYDYYDDDHWVVSVRDADNHEVGIYDYVYDRANQRIRFASYTIVRPGSPRYDKPFPYVSASSAAARLQSERGVGARASGQADLVFFPIDSTQYGPGAPHQWYGGGESPVTAMWRIPGTDNVNYFVGQDNHVYDFKDLPMKRGA
jgi:hypothetical protein